MSLLLNLTTAVTEDWNVIPSIRFRGWTMTMKFDRIHNLDCRGISGFWERKTVFFSVTTTYIVQTQNEKSSIFWDDLDEFVSSPLIICMAVETSIFVGVERVSVKYVHLQGLTNYFSKGFFTWWQHGGTLFMVMAIRRDDVFAQHQKHFSKVEPYDRADAVNSKGTFITTTCVFTRLTYACVFVFLFFSTGR